jgi:chemotaxis family two-component system response regulator Rcp1
MWPHSLTWPTALPGESCMAAPSLQPVEILLVEDSASDAELMVEALGEGRLTVRVTVIEDGEQAVQYLRRQGRHRDAPRPDLILLDQHLPRLNGHEVLDCIKNDDNLHLIPVVMLTSFDTDEVICEAYDRHVNCCVAKPADLDQFAQTVKKIETFWLRTARHHRAP